MKRVSYLFLVISVLFFSACGGDDGASGETPDEPLSNFFKPIPAEPIYPQDNPYSSVKAELGELLFWDPILSGEQNVACASCHHPDFAWADGRRFSIGSDGVGLGPDRVGFEETPVHSPSILNMAYTGLGLEEDVDFISGGYFWDLRANTLEEQALEPIKSDVEMRGFNVEEQAILPLLVERLEGIPEYVEYFAQAFEEDPIVSEENIAKALATFQRTLVTGRTRFDDYLDGDLEALSGREITGLNKFVNGGCARCHSGPLLSDNTIHLDQPVLRGKDAVRTASLRNANLTAPYMHDGSESTLNRAIGVYEERGDLDVTMDDDDIGDLRAFLDSLTNDGFYRDVPSRVPSGLKVGGDIDL